MRSQCSLPWCIDKLPRYDTDMYGTVCGENVRLQVTTLLQDASHSRFCRWGLRRSMCATQRNEMKERAIHFSCEPDQGRQLMRR